MSDPHARPHETFEQFLACVETLATEEKLAIRRSGPHGWMSGPGMPTLWEFRLGAGIQALREVWDRFPELRAAGKDEIEKVLRHHLAHKSSKESRTFIANGIWSCFLLHGTRSAESPALTPNTAVVEGGAVAAKSGRPPVQRNEQPTNRQRVDDYLARVTEKAGHKATRTDFWTVAGYKNRSDFERFQRDKKVTKTAKENFNRILEEMTPEQFLTALSEKKLSKKKTSS